MSTREQFAAWMTESYSSPNQREAPADPPVTSAEAAELAAAKAELAALKQANVLRDLRAKVSADTGVPADLLTGETEADCLAQAAAIGAYAASMAPEVPAYPRVKDGGEIRVPTAKTAAEIFSELVNSRLAFDPFRR